MIKVSIVVPIYNVANYLTKCIDSLLSQTLKEIEIILINDGSTDNSKKIIKSYKDSRIVFIDKQNSGIGSTRNLGIERAKGEYISFIDSDDYVSKYFCEKMYQKAIKDKCDVVICDYYEDNNGLIPVKFKHFEDTFLKDNPTLINNINLGPCNKIFKRELFKNKENRFEENLKYEDAPLVCKLLCEANKIGKVDEFLHYYIIHKKNQTNVRDSRIFDILVIAEKINIILSKYKYMKESSLNLLVMILTDYTIQQRYIKSSKIRNRFINDAFDYLNNINKEWRKSSYLKKFPFYKRFIKTNKILTKLYCFIYSLKIKKN